MDKDKEFQEKLSNDIMPDAYDEYERSMSWAYYLEEKVQGSFKARCIQELRQSPLNQNEIITVLGMIPFDNYTTEMLAEIKFKGRTMGVPLEQLEFIDADEDAVEALDDWKYWKSKGYQF